MADLVPPSPDLKVSCCSSGRRCGARRRSPEVAHSCARVRTLFPATRLALYCLLIRRSLHRRCSCRLHESLEFEVQEKKKKVQVREAAEKSPPADPRISHVARCPAGVLHVFSGRSSDGVRWAVGEPSTPSDQRIPWTDRRGRGSKPGDERGIT